MSRWHIQKAGVLGAGGRIGQHLNRICQLLYGIAGVYMVVMRIVLGSEGGREAVDSRR